MRLLKLIGLLVLFQINFYIFRHWIDVCQEIKVSNKYQNYSVVLQYHFQEISFFTHHKTFRKVLNQICNLNFFEN